MQLEAHFPLCDKKVPLDLGFYFTVWYFIHFQKAQGLRLELIGLDAYCIAAVPTCLSK